MTTPGSADSRGRVRLEITGLSAGGRGVGRDGTGRAWFVERAVTGDVVEAEARRVHSRFVEGRAVRLERGGPGRRTAPCPFQGACGGCPWMVLDEASQREAKIGLLRDALVRIGRFEGIPLRGFEAAPEPLAYRNKIELSFGRSPTGRRVLGLHRAGDAEAVEEIDACLLLDPASNRLLATVREFFLSGPGKDDPTVDAHPDVRVVLRSSRFSGRRLLALRGPEGSFASGEVLASVAMERHEDLAGVVRISPVPGRRGGSRADVLVGEGALEETLAGIRYAIPSTAFFQVNPAAAERLVAVVQDATAGARHVVDVFGGVGIFGLAMARAGSHVTVIEADAAAVAAGREAVARNRLSRVRFVRAGAVAGLDAVARDGPLPDVVVADPPRTGLGRGVAAVLTRLRPRRVVLVGCDPATFARDAAALRAGGFRLDRVTAIDMFPQTAHVEAVGVLERV